LGNGCMENQNEDENIKIVCKRGVKQAESRVC
jgi:hypothetical protein